MTGHTLSTWNQIFPTSFDSSGAERDIIVVYGFVLDGCLDTELLRASFEQLCTTWSILSARLRRKSKSPRDWFYLVPPRAQVSSVVQSDMSAACPVSRRSLLIEHSGRKVSDLFAFAQGSALPQERPTMHPNGRILDARPHTRSREMLLFASNAPRTLDDLFDEDRPLFSAKVTIFSDATTIGISVPHLLCDGPGAAEVMRAWIALLQGKELQPLPKVGIDFFAPLAPGGAYAVEEARAQARAGHKQLIKQNGWYAYTVGQALRLGIRFFWDVLWERPESTLERREIYLPAKYVEQAKAEAMAEIMERSTGAKTEYVSTSDVVMAVALKQICSPDVRSPADKRTLSFLHPANLRWLPGAAGILPLPQPYLHNAAYTISLPEQPIGPLVHTLSVGDVALQLRHSLQRETTPERIRRSLIWRLAHAHRLLLFWRPASKWVVGTDWRAMGLYQLSLAHALDRSIDQPAARGAVLKVWTQSIVDAPLRNTFCIVGDDPSGGIWVNMVLSTKQWARVIMP